MAFLLSLGTLILLLQLAVSQKVFIDQVPAYTNLPECAELPLSTLIRDMVSGCGDHQMTTSFSCFCTASFTAFEKIISTDVVSHCTADGAAMATSALGVFESYCHLKPRNSSAGTVPPVTSAIDPQATGSADDPLPTRTSTGPLQTSAANRNAIVGWGLLLGLVAKMAL